MTDLFADQCLATFSLYESLIAYLIAVAGAVVFASALCAPSGACSRAEEARDEAQRLREVMDAETVEMPVVEESRC
jgi:hypothetical protein